MNSGVTLWFVSRRRQHPLVLLCEVRVLREQRVTLPTASTMNREQIACRCQSGMNDQWGRASSNRATAGNKWEKNTSRGDTLTFWSKSIPICNLKFWFTIPNCWLSTEVWKDIMGSFPAPNVQHSNMWNLFTQGWKLMTLTGQRSDTTGGVWKTRWWWESRMKGCRSMRRRSLNFLRFSCSC